MKKSILILLGALIIFASVIAVKTAMYPFTEVKDLADHPKEYAVNEQSIQNLANAIRIPTISTVEYNQTNFAPFDQFISFLEQTYPLIYQQMDTVRVNKYGLVYHWKSKNPQEKPLLFLAHYDVVPINDYDALHAENTLHPIFEPFSKSTPLLELPTTWTHAPFSGAVTQGRIYGRGTLDMKGQLIAILEAANQLLEKGFEPNQDIYFAFGHDEEVSGRQGALQIASYFKQNNIEFGAVYDEGGFVFSPRAVMQSIDKAVALVGVGEKGFLTLRITVDGIGGHSSIPPKKGSLILASEIAQKLNDNQLNATIIPPIENFLTNVGGAMDLKTRVVIANRWLLQPLLIKSLENTPGSNALVRTTTAVTMMHGSDAPNVLSADSDITVNFRILQGQTVEGVLSHVKLICRDYDVDYQIISQREPSKLSDTNTKYFQKLVEIIGVDYPNAIITPYLSIGGTDAYKYELVSDQVFRFMPVELNAIDQRLIHNMDESITIDNYMRMINHFSLLMQQ